MKFAFSISVYFYNFMCSILQCAFILSCFFYSDNVRGLWVPLSREVMWVIQLFQAFSLILPYSYQLSFAVDERQTQLYQESYCFQEFIKTLNMLFEESVEEILSSKQHFIGSQTESKYSMHFVYISINNVMSYQKKFPFQIFFSVSINFKQNSRG
ncbi:transmembrane protein, putative (macronuclear) [Tetrahymena thermophila SB210]|uniref:Transmembrane protein, putative n=1 Tax=Tetrahymena thermophila (strain SB210) TaxID=312017 RepID=W7X9A1_TETTS|nr:transmembrane protein, putative [Tetrahymena thermophila SB210]EWS73927.1 transmembrane protein, putative [Tetrahymena thermophila SB210]|eukprot:XP_012653549.1 transmembrane protein, putative [Tetrahymena thermophila SB210]